jgi:protein TonB
MTAATTFGGYEPDTRMASPRLWTIAACAAVVLHAVVAGAAWYAMPSDSDEDDFGAPSIEIALDMTAPKAEQTDLPPGPEADASATSPAQMEQTKKVEDTNLPKDDPIETENPDRIVSPETPKKPLEEKPDPAQVQTNASAESVASEETAPPPSDVAKEAPQSVAPAQGIGQSARKIITTWQRQLVAYLDRHKRYPAGTSHKNVQVLARFTLDRLGHVVGASIAKGSGDASFDAAAVAMIRRSDPLPPPPPLVADEGLTFTVPVVFRTKGN